MQNRVQNKSNVTNRPAQFSWTLAEMKFNKIDKVSVFFCKCLNQEEIFCLNHLLLCWFRFARGNKKSVGLLYSLKFFSLLFCSQRRKIIWVNFRRFILANPKMRNGIFIYIIRLLIALWEIFRKLIGKEKLFDSRRFELIVDFSGLFMLCRK